MNVISQASIAWLALSKRWVVLRSFSESKNLDPEHPEIVPGPEETAGLAELQKKGLQKYNDGKDRAAEELWRAALPNFEAIADLGFLLAKTGKDVEAEPYLIEAAHANRCAASWLNLGDLYWKNGHKQLAANAYRNYLQAYEREPKNKLTQKPPIWAHERAEKSASRDIIQ